VIRRCAIWLLADEQTTAELDRLKGAVDSWDALGVEELLKLCDEEDFREAMAKILAFFYPPKRHRLYMGTRRVYLIARGFLPELVKVDGQEMTFERMAEILEGEVLRTKKDRGRARSRWSARVQTVLRKPIEAAGGTARVQFSKSGTARGKMARSAKGNGNRRKSDG